MQKLFFEIVRTKMSPNIRLVDVICDVLNIGSDSAYRRLRGEKELTFSELLKLSSHFDVSIDSLSKIQSNNVLFKYSPLDLDNIEKYYNYINNLGDIYGGLAKSENKEIIATAQDIPIFHFMPFMDLSFFKLYAWDQSMGGKPTSFEKFVSSMNGDQVATYYNNIYDAYKKIPSIEVWTTSTIEPILRLLDYYSDIDSFENKDNPILLCHQLLLLIENVEQWTEKGYKDDCDSEIYFRLYLSVVDMENNFVISKNDNSFITGLKLFTINAILTSNNDFCVETEKWVINIISKSLLLSGASARERYKFFQQLRNKVNILCEKFESRY